MPAIIAILLQGLLFLTKSIVGRALVALGIGIVTYKGMDTTMTWLRTGAINALNGMGAEYVQLLSFMKVGVSINIIVSAIIARALINGLSSEGMKRWIIK